MLFFVKKVISKIVCTGSGKIKQHEKITCLRQFFQKKQIYTAWRFIPETAYKDGESIMVSTSKYLSNVEANVFAAGKGIETAELAANY